MSRKSNSENKINYYEIFGLQSSATKKEILTKYRELVKKYHPDKNSSKDSKIFEVIQMAWECLGNDEKRKEYDGHIEKQKNNNHDFFSMKNKFNEYTNLKKEELTEEARSKALLEYQRINEELNEKIYVEFKFDKLTGDELEKKMEDYIFSREQEELENEQTQIFDDKEKFDHIKFNLLYDKYKSKQSTDVIIRDKMIPFNFSNDECTNLNFNNVTNTSTEDYTVINELNMDEMRISREDLKKIKPDTSTYDKHKKDPVTEDSYKDLLEKRKQETEELNKIPMNKFINDPDSSYMFTHETAKLEYQDNYDDDVITACNKLIENESKT